MDIEPDGLSESVRVAEIDIDVVAESVADTVVLTDGEVDAVKDVLGVKDGVNEHDAEGESKLLLEMLAAPFLHKSNKHVMSPSPIT